VFTIKKKRSQTLILSQPYRNEGCCTKTGQTDMPNASILQSSAHLHSFANQVEKKEEKNLNTAQLLYVLVHLGRYTRSLK